ncbi:Glycosyl transferase, family 2 [Caenispirillum salinarum AK4]|uniref:Glycosyl transferase, family 2 n=1 Tax=Caenispirillum salinarum AK4 TaxID=1238182 RepID=K9GLW8_9PROT|nr:glycosyltransferase family 2 protein [Caenispirillum salinarum]EKV26042.1 Glycosyl transferase, family 2 [Caenispirillum salinarum AK4]
MPSERLASAEAVEISLVMPAYNEAAGITDVVERAAAVLRDIGRPFEIVVVDDGSTDDTIRVLTETRRTVPELRIHRLRVNAGQHIATVAGLRAARGALVLLTDADEHVPPENIRALLTAAEAEPHADVIAGARARRSSARHRDVGSRLVTLLVNRLTRMRLTDPATTFRLFRRSAVHEILQADVLAQNVPILVGFLRLRIVEVPVTVRPSEVRRSRYGILRLAHILFLALLNFSAGTTTILSLMAVGSLAGATGIAGLATLVALGVALQQELPTNWLLFFVLLLIVGLQFVLVGAVAYKVERINMNLRFRRQLEATRHDADDD